MKSVILERILKADKSVQEAILGASEFSLDYFWWLRSGPQGAYNVGYVLIAAGNKSIRATADELCRNQESARTYLDRKVALFSKELESEYRHKGEFKLSYLGRPFDIVQGQKVALIG